MDITDVVTTTEKPAEQEPISIFQCSNCGAKLPSTGVKTLPPTTCINCKGKFDRNEAYIDMTGLEVSNEGGIFQLSQVSYVYERGWRSHFRRAGFPGPLIEAQLALDYLLPCDILIDLSCGSGIITRKLAEESESIVSNLNIIACDISKSMIIEAYNQVSDKHKNSISFMRCDVSNLPFQDKSIQAFHSSAAIHCWPDLKVALHHIFRCLKPNGKFFATTFLKAPYWPRDGILGQSSKYAIPIIDKIQSYIPIANNYHFYDKDELIQHFTDAGFDNVDVEVSGGCAIIRCFKPANVS